MLTQEKEPTKDVLKVPESKESLSAQTKIEKLYETFDRSTPLFYSFLPNYLYSLDTAQLTTVQEMLTERTQDTDPQQFWDSVWDEIQPNVIEKVIQQVPEYLRDKLNYAEWKGFIDVYELRLLEKRDIESKQKGDYEMLEKIERDLFNDLTHIIKKQIPEAEKDMEVYLYGDIWSPFKTKIPQQLYHTVGLLDKCMNEDIDPTFEEIAQIEIASDIFYKRQDGFNENDFWYIDSSRPPDPDQTEDDLITLIQQRLYHKSVLDIALDRTNPLRREDIKREINTQLLPFRGEIFPCESAMRWTPERRAKLLLYSRDINNDRASLDLPRISIDMDAIFLLSPKIYELIKLDDTVGSQMYDLIFIKDGFDDSLDYERETASPLLLSEFLGCLVHELEHLASCQEFDILEGNWIYKVGVMSQRYKSNPLLNALDEVLIEASTNNRIVHRENLFKSNYKELLQKGFDLKAIATSMHSDDYAYSKITKELAKLLNEQNIVIPWKDVRKFLYKGHVLELYRLLKQFVPAENLRAFAELKVEHKVIKAEKNTDDEENEKFYNNSVYAEEEVDKEDDWGEDYFDEVDEYDLDKEVDGGEEEDSENFERQK